MNKAELIDVVAKNADISKTQAARVIDSVIQGVSGSLKKGRSVTLVGFGTFYVTKRAARTWKNPRSQETHRIKATKVPKFRAGKALKQIVN